MAGTKYSRERNTHHRMDKNATNVDIIGISMSSKSLFPPGKVFIGIPFVSGSLSTKTTQGWACLTLQMR